MAGSREVYAPEFEHRAAETVAEPKLSVAEAGRRLDAHEGRRHEWRTAVGTGGPAAVPGSGHQTPAGEENRRPEAEVTRPGMGRDAPGKAAAFFAAPAE